MHPSRVHVSTRDVNRKLISTQSDKIENFELNVSMNIKWCEHKNIQEPKQIRTHDTFSLSYYLYAHHRRIAR